MRSRIVTPSLRDPAVATLTEWIRSRGESAGPEVIVGDRLEDGGSFGANDVTFVIVTDRSSVGTVVQIRPVVSGSLFAIGPAKDAKFILRVIQAGADSFLDETDLPAELAATYDRIRAKRPRGETPRRLLAVLSASGGCGASTVATNLSVLLAKSFGRCHLIDMNPSQADLSSLLDVKPQFTMTDLCRNEGRLDRTMYEKMLTTHPSGVALLAAPRLLEDVRSLTAEAVSHALAIARDVFADIVVDLEDCLHDEQLIVLGEATTVFVVSRPDFTTARNTRLVIDRLVALGVPRSRIEVVLNHVGRPNELPRAEVEVAVGGPVAHELPYDPERVCWSNNTGLPVAIKEPNCPFTRALGRLVGLAPVGPGPETFPSRVGTWVRGVVLPRVLSLWRRARPHRPDDETVESLTILEDTDTSHEPNTTPQLDRHERGAVAS